MSLLRPFITDDRGRRVPLAPIEWRWSAPSEERRRRRARLWEAHIFRPRVPVTRGEVLRGVLWGCVMFLPVLPMALLPALLTFGLNWSWWAIPAMLPFSVAPAVCSLIMIRQIAPHRVAQQYGRAGYCGSCAYDLRLIPRAPDECRVCPECGAAWKAEQMSGYY